MVTSVRPRLYFPHGSATRAVVGESHRRYRESAVSSSGLRMAPKPAFDGFPFHGFLDKPCKPAFKLIVIKSYTFEAEGRFLKLLWA